MNFGDEHVRQVSGTAMGISSAPPFATIYFGIYEDNILLPKWFWNLLIYIHFIGDLLGMWMWHHDPVEDAQLWNEFKDAMNTHKGLTWTFTEPSLSCDFMDLTISIVKSKIETTLYEKSLNWYLHKPPHSAHALGRLPGLVVGGILQIWQLCTHKADILQTIKEFYHRLLHRGYMPSTLRPLFIKADANALQHLDHNEEEASRIWQQKELTGRRKEFLHFKYHPNNPPSYQTQCLWCHLVLRPYDMGYGTEPL